MQRSPALGGIAVPWACVGRLRRGRDDIPTPRPTSAASSSGTVKNTVLDTASAYWSRRSCCCSTSQAARRSTGGQCLKPSRDSRKA